MTAIKACPPALVIAHHPEFERVGNFVVLERGKEIVLGKAADTHDPHLFLGTTASRRQLRLVWNKDAVSFTCMRSRNPTTINGQIVHEGLITSGDVIGLGDVLLVYRAQTEGNTLTSTIPGVSDKAFHIHHRIQTLAAQEVSSLIQGPVGTEKRRVANALHETSQKVGAFVALDCSQFTEEDLRQRLFQHADVPLSSGPSLINAAIGGTLFIDNAQEMSSNTLQDIIDHGKDVYLLFGVTHVCEALDELPAIFLPPLRNRKEDIPHWIRLFCTDFNCTRASWEIDLARHFIGYSWPGNIEELRRIIHRLCDESGDGNIWRLTTSLSQRLSPIFLPPKCYAIEGLTSDTALTHLRAHGGRIHAVAKALNVESSALLDQLIQWNIDPSSFQ